MHHLTQRPNRPRDDRVESDGIRRGLGFRRGLGWMNAT
jgi:hypothetical protein